MKISVYSSRFLFFTLLLMTSWISAFAQAQDVAGKTLHFLSPWDTTAPSVNLNWNNIVLSHDSGAWYSLTFATGGNYWSGFSFIAAQANGDNNWDYQYATDGIRYQNAPQDPERFTDAIWGSGTEVWIIPDWTDPKKAPIISTTPPKYLRILNPEDWVLGVPQLVLNGGTPTNLQVDRVRCGWYYTMLIGDGPYTGFLRNSSNGEVFGLDGYDDSTAFDFSAQFTQGTEEIYLETDFITLSSTDPQISGECTYSLAAIIRDFSWDTHPDFHLPCGTSWFQGDSRGQCDSYGYSGLHNHGGSSGIPCQETAIFDMVLPTLGADRKPQENVASGCFQDFGSLFNTDPTGVKNTEHCVDLVFSRSNDGLWEYDSNNEDDRGYFPLEAEPDSGHSRKFPAQCAAPLLPNWENTFDNIDPATLGPGADLSVYWDWAARDALSCPDADSKGFRQRNQQFCFESHAEFVYTASGQNFSFRGDDDIWVFINNQRVVDNGGMHLPVPANVNLDAEAASLGLIAGTQYPIDIFFCDRKPTSSNVRIKTDMYFKQRKGLYYDQSGNTYVLNKVEGGTGNCAALQNPGGETTIPGSTLPLEYILMDTRGNVIDLTLAPGGLLTTGIVNFGGIDLTVLGTVTINEDAITGLGPGRYRLVIQEVDNGAVRTYITFRVAGNLAMVDIGPNNALLTPADTAAFSGEMVAVFVVNKADEFIDTTDAAFSLTWDAGLLVFQDPDGLIPVEAGDMLTTGDDGIDTLYVTGIRSAPDELPRTISLGGRGGKKTITFTLPRLHFVDAAGVHIADPKPTLGYNGLSLGDTIHVEATRPDGTPCLTLCNDLLSITTLAAFTFNDMTGAEITSLQLVDGVASFILNVSEKVTDASFTLTGESPITTTTWANINLEPPPVAQADSAVMYDDNGDGIADHMVVWYDRPIDGEYQPDSIRIFWTSDLDTTGLLYTQSAIPDLILSANTIEVFNDSGFTNIPVTSGSGNITTYKQVDIDGLIHNDKRGKIIRDRIGPIALKAQIRIAVKPDRFDTIKVFLSEPVNYDSILAPLDQNLFEFVLISEGFQKTTLEPLFTTWRENGDTVTLFFNPELDPHPRAGDSVHIAVGEGLLTDTLGNPAHANNPYRILDGERRLETETYNEPWQFDPSDPAYIQRVEEQGPTYTQLITDMYSPIKDLIEDSLQTLGHLIKVDLGEIYDTQVGLYDKLELSEVILHIKTMYWTNLGGFVASHEQIITCDDESIYGVGESCRTSRGFIFVGWNFQTNNKRWVGTGAYVTSLVSKVSVKGRTFSGSRQKVQEIWGVIRGRGFVR